MQIQIKKLTDTAIIPTKATDGAAGFDLYADSFEEDPHIHASQNVVVHTGVAMAIPKGYVGLIFARSGHAFKYGIRPVNCVGVIDSDYRGEIMVKLHQDLCLGDLYDPDTLHESPVAYYCAEDAVKSLYENTIITEIEKGERVAQIVFVKYNDEGFVEVDELPDTNRGDGGFGSTGTK